MNSLDLRIRPPRGPREKLDGLVLMLRTIDKIRATLPGGHLGPYHIAPGMSQLLLSIIRVEISELRRTVMRAGSDDEVAAWLRLRADTSYYARANAVLSEFRQEHIPEDQRPHFESLYPEYLRARYPIVFDVIEADDRELYPDLEKR